MDVQLYVYDLSQGLARQFSQALTGIQIDAIYHTAIVLNHVEYFFGQGIHRKIPGTTHHGRPMKIINLGKTELPLDVIEEYVESLEHIYTPESYDLFLHNCNNFTQDLAMFLVGTSIPDEIRTLPETFLNTPMGQMLRGQIDQSMRTMTQAPDAVAGRHAIRNPPAAKTEPATRGSKPHSGTAHRVTTPGIINARPPADSPGHVHNISSLSELDRLLESSRQSCAVIFFTSAACPPCKIVYPTYDDLAAEAGFQSGAKLIKIDVSASPSTQAVAQRYQIRATPTFITFLKGEKHEEWSGANTAQLKGNVRLLLQMATPPPHRHSKLKLPTFQRIIETPIMYTRTPPLDKLLAKIGSSFSQDPSVQDLVVYIQTRDAKGMNEAPLPNLHNFSTYLATVFPALPQESHFAVIDLVRVAAVDSRVSSFFVTEHDHRTLSTLLTGTRAGEDVSTAPYNIQSVSLQLACNLFSSNVFQEQIFRDQNATSPPSSPPSGLRTSIETVAAQCLLSPHPNARSMAAALVYNLAAHTHNQRMHNTKGPGDEESTPSDDLSAALLESITSLASGAQSASSSTHIKETLHALLLALGMLLYAAPPDNMLWDLCRAMGLREVLKEITSSGSGLSAEVQAEPLLKEVGDELLGKGGF
ncbi:uncharacterized protein Z518_03444 [Rhinocladiella mackenziei CBS 650.93]|uniref:Thioredoxin n=1 Tax=Rhinocladiella mackenziei CBS 650.93 TaxID=1442369 RepID=A0A0D2G2L0_9EURO|nr:uncharacterized protein Z518_03444 [Rhinocladiella mackenziei CBS 650.93]KIX08787.1 hypothetical protein Z518_03444 [Rhinocladiella mackenziei CBS 650.93]